MDALYITATLLFLPFHNVFVSPSATARKTRPLSTFLLQKQSSVMLYIRNVQRDENFTTRRGFDQTSFKQRTCLQEHFFTTLTITSLQNSRNNKKERNIAQASSRACVRIYAKRKKQTSPNTIDRPDRTRQAKT